VAVDVMSGVLREQADAGRPVVFSSHQLELVERISDLVGIVRAGSMVAVGAIDDLRRTEHRRWSVDGPPGPDWASAVADVHVVSSAGTVTVVEDAPGATPDVDQAVLRAALGAGPVRAFSLVRPSLTELYRDVVTAEPTDATTAAKDEVA